MSAWGDISDSQATVHKLSLYLNDLWHVECKRLRPFALRQVSGMSGRQVSGVSTRNASASKRAVSGPVHEEHEENKKVGVGCQGQGTGLGEPPMLGLGARTKPSAGSLGLWVATGGVAGVRPDRWA